MIAPPQAVNYAPKPIPTKYEGDALAQAVRLGCALADGAMAGQPPCSMT